MIIVYIWLCVWIRSSAFDLYLQYMTVTGRFKHTCNDNIKVVLQIKKDLNCGQRLIGPRFVPALSRCVCTVFCLYRVVFVPCCVCPVLCLYRVVFVPCSVCTVLCLYRVVFVPCCVCTVLCLYRVVFVPCSVCTVLCLYRIVFVPCSLCTVLCLYRIVFVPCSLCTVLCLYRVVFVPSSPKLISTLEVRSWPLALVI